MSPPPPSIAALEGRRFPTRHSQEPSSCPTIHDGVEEPLKRGKDGLWGERWAVCGVWVCRGVGGCMCGCVEVEDGCMCGCVEVEDGCMCGCVEVEDGCMCGCEEWLGG